MRPFTLQHVRLIYSVPWMRPPRRSLFVPSRTLHRATRHTPVGRGHIHPVTVSVPNSPLPNSPLHTSGVAPPRPLYEH